MAIYTSCVSVDNHKGLFFWVGGGGLAGVVAALAILAVGGAAVPAYAIAALITLIAYCHWWLTDRLICLGGDRCAIGLLGCVETPAEKSGLDRFDTDYSVNLILAPHNFQELPSPLPPPPPPPPLGPSDPDEPFKQAMHHKIADDGIQGDLIRETDTTGNKKTILGAKRYPFEGMFNKLGAAGVVYKHQPYLHCEFEGGGVKDLLDAAETALALATAAAVVCSIPFFGTIACAILGIVAAIIMIAGIANALADKGSPTDVNPDLKEIHQSADVLVIKGRWVFDTAHEGWNEIHPVTYAQRVGYYDIQVYPNDLPGYWFSLLMDWRKQKDPGISPTDLTKPATNDDWKEWVRHWCDNISQAQTPLTRDNQNQPQNQWTIHPEIDSCQPQGDPGGVIR